jgi:hypothetical protein
MSEYLIAHIGHTTKSHEHILWWRAESKGYTFCVDKAGRYDEAHARRICLGSGTCIAVKPEAAKALARTTPYYRRANGDLHRMYDGGEHAPVPNTLDAWRELLGQRLPECGAYDKPTPIGKKAGAIYLPKQEGGAA